MLSAIALMPGVAIDTAKNKPTAPRDGVIHTMTGSSGLADPLMTHVLVPDRG
jgi:hypothetical protein